MKSWGVSNDNLVVSNEKFGFCNEVVVMAYHYNYCSVSIRQKPPNARFQGRESVRVPRVSQLL